MKKDKCPICGNKLTAHTVSVMGTMGDIEGIDYVCMAPFTMPTPNGLVVNYHYKSWTLSGELPYQEEFHIYPYVVKIWDKSFGYLMDIHKYDKLNNLRYIVGVPIVDLPWDNLEKVKNKLQTITVFS
jgi:hypothetical protein